VATGEIFSAPRAKKLGLIDEIGYIDAAIERAKELAHLDDQDVRVVEYQRKVPALVEALGGAQRPKVGLSNMSLNGLLDLTAPRDYYLATWLPALLKSRP